uniref:Uncharacterized protein n=1 Tax=Tetraselmis sp. GSL018 TaxID=582737 RepID=A0A061SFR7_9CHLO
MCYVLVQAFWQMAVIRGAALLVDFARWQLFSYFVHELLCFVANRAGVPSPDDSLVGGSLLKRVSFHAKKKKLSRKAVKKLIKKLGKEFGVWSTIAVLLLENGSQVALIFATIFGRLWSVVLSPLGHVSKACTLRQAGFDRQSTAGSGSFLIPLPQAFPPAGTLFSLAGKICGRWLALMLGGALYLRLHPVLGGQWSSAAGPKHQHWHKALSRFRWQWFAPCVQLRGGRRATSPFCALRLLLNAYRLPGAQEPPRGAKGAALGGTATESRPSGAGGAPCWGPRPGAEGLGAERDAPLRAAFMCRPVIAKRRLLRRCSLRPRPRSRRQCAPCSSCEGPLPRGTPAPEGAPWPAERRRRMCPAAPPSGRRG